MERRLRVTLLVCLLPGVRSHGHLCGESLHKDSAPLLFDGHPFPSEMGLLFLDLWVAPSRGLLKCPVSVAH